jgi:hypothetical protein
LGAYTLGTAVTIRETFTVLGTPTDPTTVVFTVQGPDGVDTIYTFGIDGEVTHPAVGVYVLDLAPPPDPGVYFYSVTGTGSVEATGTGDFTVLQSATDPAAVTWAVDGPCTPWCDANDIWISCGSPTVTVGTGSDEEIVCVDMAPYAQMASWLLWELSGRLHSGRCIRTVRPCGDNSCGFQVLSRGYVVWPSDWYFGYSGYGWNGWNWMYDHNAGCGCIPLDRIDLAGYPVREILEVKIDGVVVPAQDNWRLDKRRFLTRMADADGNPQYWPACQRLDEDDTEVGTFAVTYAYGQDPPLLGQMAAAQIGCEIYRDRIGEECKLPAGTVRVTRQGVTIDKLATLSWFRSSTSGWKTGLGVVDAFLNAINPYGLTRRPVMMAPGQRRNRFAQSVGQGTP